MLTTRLIKLDKNCCFVIYLYYGLLVNRNLL
jgi:hypothetical protein